MHSELNLKRFGGEGKQNMVLAMHQDLGSDSGNETQIRALGIQGNLFLHANENYEFHASTSSSNESLVSE